VSTTYTDAFTGSGTLAGHAADSGFGTWTTPSVKGLGISGGRVDLTQLVNFNPSINEVGNPIAAYTKSADAYFDVSLPVVGGDQYVGIYNGVGGAVALDLFRTEGTPGAWDINFCGGYTYEAAANVGAIVVGTPFRLGCVHDVVAGTARLYTEPYGGGTRTWVGDAQATTVAWSDSARLLYLRYNAYAFITGGYLDNLAIVTTDTTGPASAVTSTVTPSPASIAADGVATSALTIQLKDSTGVNLTGSSGTITIATPACGTISALADVGNGTWTATYTACTTVGVYTITPALDGVPFTLTTTITLTAPPVATVTVAAKAIVVGKTTQFAAVTKDVGGNVLTGRVVTWASSDATVATVSATGLATGVSYGTVTITATSETIAGTPGAQTTSWGIAVTGTATIYEVDGGVSPKKVTVTDGGIGGLVLSTTTYDARATGWLTPSLSTATSPSWLTLTAVIGDLPRDNYTATVTLTSSTATNSPYRMDVTFVPAWQSEMGSAVTWTPESAGATTWTT
jgi:hypothetical protein